MSVMYILLPLGVLLSAVSLTAFIWMTKRGQMDDLDTPPLRMLQDDE